MDVDEGDRGVLEVGVRKEQKDAGVQELGVENLDTNLLRDVTIDFVADSFYEGDVEEAEDQIDSNNHY